MEKQAGLTVQTPVTDLEAIIVRYVHHDTAVSNVFKKQAMYDYVPTSNFFSDNLPVDKQNICVFPHSCLHLHLV